MRRFFDFAKKWKSNPICMVIPCRECGNKSSRLYQYSDGGFIKAKCSVCGADNLFSKDEFIFLPPFPCPECNKEMKPEQLKIDYANACYTCEGCKIYIRLADLLPDSIE
jgi:hypothetical protein